MPIYPERISIQLDSKKHLVNVATSSIAVALKALQALRLLSTDETFLVKLDMIIIDLAGLQNDIDNLIE